MSGRSRTRRRAHRGRRRPRRARRSGARWRGRCWRPASAPTTGESGPGRSWHPSGRAGCVGACRRCCRPAGGTSTVVGRRVEGEDGDAELGVGDGGLEHRRRALSAGGSLSVGAGSGSAFRSSPLRGDRLRAGAGPVPAPWSSAGGAFRFGLTYCWPAMIVQGWQFGSQSRGPSPHTSSVQFGGQLQRRPASRDQGSVVRS